MKTFLMFAVLLTISPAFAWISIAKVTPDWTAARGVTASAQKNSDGTFQFTVTRYLPEAPQAEDGEKMKVERFAVLQVRNGKKLLASTQVAAQIEKDKAIYTFSLSRDCIESSLFSMEEFFSFKGNRLSGETIYQIDLLACAPSAKPLYHP